MKQFAEQLKRLLEIAIHEQGVHAGTYHDDIVSEDMRRHEGITRLNAMSNVDFLECICEGYSDD